MAIGVDIKTLREPAEAEKFRVSEKRRFRKPELIDQVLALDEAYRKANFDREQFKKKITKEVMQPMAQRKKESKGADACEDLIALKDKLEVELEVFVKAEDEALTKRDEKLGTVGNLIDDSVPVSKDEDKDNEVVATWGTPRAFTEKYQTNGFRPHFELLEMIGGVNFDAGRDVAGDDVHHTVRELKRLEELFRLRDDVQVLLVRLLGLANDELLDLLELVHAEGPPNVPPRAARLLSEARRGARIPQRQRGSVDDFVAVQRSDRLF